MARVWLCGSGWSVWVWTPLSSNGSTITMSTSPTGTQTTQSSPLRHPAVSSTLERCVLVCVCLCVLCATPAVASSRFALECVTSGLSVPHGPCVGGFFWRVSICRHTAGRSVTAHTSCLLCARGKERWMNQHSLAVPRWVFPALFKLRSKACCVFIALSWIVLNLWWRCLTSVHFSGLEKTRQVLLSD